MDGKPFMITLLPSLADAPEDSEEYQTQLRTFVDSLRAGGFIPSSEVLLIEAVGNDATPYIGVFHAALAGSISILSAALGAWLKERYGR